MKAKTYSRNTMEAIRQSRGLGKNDTSDDKKIMTMKKEDAFNAYCIWNGLLGGYGYLLLETVEDVYGVNLLEDD